MHIYPDPESSLDRDFLLANYEAYQALLGELYDTIPRTNLDIRLKRTLPMLIERLRAFADDQFFFFLDGFSQDKLSTIDELPPAFILSKILEQISNDLNVLEQIADDWQNPQKVPSLKQATVLANNALELAFQNNFLTTQVTSLPYLHRSPVIRVIPYAGAALIGIPYTAVTSLRGLLAIPHEVGHYVYWNGQYKGKAIHEYLYTELVNAGLGKYSHWLEEIFSDVYSSFVAGTVTAQSIQDILLDNRPILSDLDDGTHPPDVIRPHVYAYTYPKSNPRRAEIIANWEGRLDRLGINKAFKLARIERDPKNKRIESLQFDNVPFDGDDIGGRAVIETIVNLVTDIFNDKNEEGRWTNRDFGTAVYNEIETLINDSGSRLFIDNYNSLIDLPLTDGEAGVHNFIKTREDLFAQMPKKESLAFEEWYPVYKAAGWTGSGEEDGYRTVEG